MDEECIEIVNSEYRLNQRADAVGSLHRFLTPRLNIVLVSKCEKRDVESCT